MKHVLFMVAALAIHGTTLAQVAPTEPPSQATTDTAMRVAPTTDASTAVGQPDPAAAAAGKTVPPLALSWDCGDCEQNEKVIPLIHQEYAAYAKQAGFSVSETMPAIPVRISDYRQRPPGVRVMFGIMAGKDRLKVALDDHGKAVELGDTVANAWVGMDYLCAKAGSQLFSYLSTGKQEN